MWRNTLRRQHRQHYSAVLSLQGERKDNGNARRLHYSRWDADRNPDEHVRRRGVGSSSVAASTLYYIYLWNHSGTWVLDAETTGHATDSSTGIEIMSGDDTKTLVGMIHTDSNAKIMTGGQTHVARDTNTVATWDNRIPTYTRCQFTNDRTETATSYTEVNSENRCYFMSWADTATLSPSQSGYSNTAGGNIVTKVSVDSSRRQRLYILDRNSSRRE